MQSLQGAAGVSRGSVIGIFSALGGSGDLMRELEDAANRELRRIGAHRLDAQDIVCAAIGRAWQKHGDFSGGTQHDLLRWIQGMLSGEARNSWRRERTGKHDEARHVSRSELTDDTPAAEPGPLDLAIIAERAEMFHCALARLSDSERDALLRNLLWNERGQDPDAKLSGQERATRLRARRRLAEELRRAGIDFEEPRSTRARESRDSQT